MPHPSNSAPRLPPFWYWFSHRHVRAPGAAVRCLLFLVALGSCWGVGRLRAETVVVINEFDADQAGGDANEFLELFAYDSLTGQGVPHFALDGYVVVFFNGGAAGNGAYAVTPVGGTATAAVALDGQSTNSAGFFVIGSPGVEGAALQLSPGAAGWMQNGADGIGLYRNPTTSFIVGTPATPDALVDAVVYGTEDLDDLDLLEILTPGGTQINEPANGTEAVARVPDGGTPFDSSVFAPRAPTPGSLNQPIATLTLTFTPPVMTEAGTRVGTVIRNGSTAEAVTVTFLSSDTSELAPPASLVIPSGADSATLTVAAVDDGWPDGPQVVELSATAPGYVPASVSLTVADDGDAEQPLVINEVFASGNGDANQDGLQSTQQDRFNDEFVEIVNRGVGPVDLSGHQLFTSSTDLVRHVFPAGTVLLPGGAIVVFGGGSPPLGMTAGFGTAWIQVASAPSFGLFLVEPEARLSLQDPAGREVAGFVYRDQSNTFDSVTLSPDLTGQPVQHGSVNESSASFSPGTRADGRAFVELTASLALEVAPMAVAEGAGPGAAILRVERSGPLAEALVVAVASDDASEAVPATPTITIPAGQSAASVGINILDDATSDGAQTVTMTCVAAGHLNGSATLVVDDDSRDAPPSAVFINEIDTDQPGSDTGEFIELSVGEAASRALDGFMVVLFNGGQSVNGAYRVIDLTGYTTGNDGLFVIGNAGVPGVDLVIPASTLQNGADAIAVYRGPPSAFSTVGTPTPPVADGLIDAVVYGNGSGEDADLIAAFQAAGGLPTNSLSQQNEGDPNNAAALARVPDATDPFGTFVTQNPSPGAPNQSAGVKDPTIAIALVDDRLVITFTGVLEQSATLLDASFAPVPGATSPYSLPMPDGGAHYFRAARR